MRSLSAELKLAAAVLLVTLLAALAGARIAGEIYERAVAGAGLEKLRRASDVFLAQERAEVERLASVLDLLAHDEEIIQAYQARDRERLLALTRPLLDTMRTRDRVTHWYFIEPDARVFLRVHRPELRGDVVERLTLRKARESGQLFAGKELGKTAFALRVVRPWIVDGQVIGYLELAEELRHFLAAMKARSGDDYGLAVDKAHLDHAAWVQALDGRPDTWNDRPDKLVVEVTTFEEGITDYDGDIDAIPEGGIYLGEVERGGHTLLRGVFPVLDVSGHAVGGLFVLRDDTGDRRAVRAAHLRAALMLLGIALAGGLATLWLVRLLVFDRLGRLRREIESRAAEVGLPESRVVVLRSEDELGRLERIFDRMLFPLRPREAPGPGRPAEPGPPDRDANRP
jgi:hypothetical protein